MIIVDSSVLSGISLSKRTTWVFFQALALVRGRLMKPAHPILQRITFLDLEFNYSLTACILPSACEDVQPALLVWTNLLTVPGRSGFCLCAVPVALHHALTSRLRFQGCRLVFIHGQWHRGRVRLRGTLDHQMSRLQKSQRCVRE